jgi:hypothetical protein
MITEKAIKDAFYHLSQAREDLYKAVSKEAFCYDCASYLTKEISMIIQLQKEA